MLSPVDFLRNAQINTDYGPSPSIWADCPTLEFVENPGKGIHYFTDFREMSTLVTPTITTQILYHQGWKAFGDSGATITSGGVEGGQGLVFTETDDNEGYSIAQIALPFKIAQGKGDLWFEARLKTDLVANSDLGFVIGLWEQQTLSATVPIAAAGTLADANFVGFWRLEGDGDQIDTTYKSNGNTQVIVDADAITTSNSSAGALVADTYIKLGMKFQASNNTLYWYINGVRLPDSYTVTSTAGNPFPNDVQLGLVFAGLQASANTTVTTLAWIRAAQKLVA